MSVSTTSPRSPDLLAPGPRASRRCRRPRRARAGPGAGRSSDSVNRFQSRCSAAGHQVVHQVVVAGDGIEHAAHARAFSPRGDLLVAEIGGGGRRASLMSERDVYRASSDIGYRPSFALQPRQVLPPLLLAVAAELVQVRPRVQPGVVAIVEYEAHRVVADRLDAADADLCLPSTSVPSPAPWPLHFGRRRVHAQVFERQLEVRAVVEASPRAGASVCAA